jgi:hypothetical protein
LDNIDLALLVEQYHSLGSAVGVIAKKSIFVQYKMPFLLPEPNIALLQNALFDNILVHIFEVNNFKVRRDLFWQL